MRMDGGRAATYADPVAMGQGCGMDADIAAGLRLIEAGWWGQRSLVGPGMDALFDRLAEAEPDLERLEFPSGSPAFTWTVPPAWTLRRAAIRRPDGTELWSTDDHPLAVWTGSEPVDAEIDRDTLFADHLDWDHDRPEAVPYGYVYHRRGWGFSIPAARLGRLAGDRYRVTIDASLEPGTMTVGRLVVPGRLPLAVLVGAHVDHPCQVTDGLSGAAGALALARRLRRRTPLFTTVFLFVPETIGSLAYFHHHPADHDFVAGLFLDMLSHDGPLVVQRSLGGDSLLDRAAARLAPDLGEPVRFTGFRELPGNDEAVFNANGIGIPSTLVMRWPFAFYHTSADDLSALDPGAFARGVDFATALIADMERAVAAVTTYGGPLCLSAHGLWARYGDGRLRGAFEVATALLDGRHEAAEAAARAGLDAGEMARLIDDLVRRDLAVRCPT